MIKYFKVQEIEDLICGEQGAKWDVSLLQESIVPSHGYEKCSLPYKSLLQYMTQLDKNMQKAFLKYITGSPRLPLGGFSSLSPKLTVALRLTPEGHIPDEYLPSVMTCQNYLKIPDYSSYSVLKSKFDYALAEGQNEFNLT